MKNGYIKATGLYTIGSVFNKAIALLLLPVFTRLLSKSSYGIVSTYTSWVNIAVIIVGVQLNLSLRPAYIDYKDEFDRYTHAMNILTSIISVAVMAITVSACVVTTEKSKTILAVCCILQSYMTAIINIELQKQMMEFAYVQRTILLALPNLLSAVVGIVVLIFFPTVGFWGRIIPMVFVHLLIGGAILVKYACNNRRISFVNYWRYALVFSVPLIFHGLANVLLSNIDRTMITAYRSAAETGAYSVAYTMGMVLIAVTSALESVWIPWFTKMMNANRKKDVNQIGRLYIWVGAIITVAAITCMPEVLKIFTEKSYWDAVNILPPIMLASYVIFLFTICVNIEYYYRQTKHIAINTLIATSINIALNLMFIPHFGAVAAAYTTLISYSVSFALHYCFANKLDKEIFQIRMYIVPTTLVVIGTLITYGCRNTPILRWSFAFLVIISSMIAAYRKRKYIFDRT